MAEDIKHLSGDDVISNSRVDINNNFEMLMRNFPDGFPDNPESGMHVYVADKWHTFDGTDWIEDSVIHFHDNIYERKGDLSTLLLGKANVIHTHDDDYYDDLEVGQLLDGKADVDHMHDDRYETKTNLNEMLANHDHSGYAKTSYVNAMGTIKADKTHSHDEFTQMLRVNNNLADIDNVNSTNANLGFSMGSWNGSTSYSGSGRSRWVVGFQFEPTVVLVFPSIRDSTTNSSFGAFKGKSTSGLTLSGKSLYASSVGSVNPWDRTGCVYSYIAIKY